MSLSKEEKIKRFKSEQIKLILFICSTDLKPYQDESLILFAEAIEGVADNLFIETKLQELEGHFKFTDQIINKFIKLGNELASLYAPKWHEKLKRNGLETKKIRDQATELLMLLNIQYNEPLNYMEHHLEIDW